MGNQIVNRLPSLKEPCTALKILETIGESGALFDQLALEWTDGGHSEDGYQARSQRFEGLVKGARRAVEEDYGR